MNAPAGSSVERLVAEHARVADALSGSGHDWLRELRRRALEDFSRTGLPNQRQEHWKYTSIAPIEKQGFHALAAAPEQAPALDPAAFAYPGLECVQLAFVDGALRQGPAGALPAGLTIESLAERLERGDSSLEPVLQAGGGELHSGFVPLNAAFAGEGAVIDVADGAEVALPVHLLFVASAREEPWLCNPRIVVRVGRGARLRIVETYRGAEGANNLTNTMTQIVAGEGAAVEHYRVQEESHTACHIGNLMVEQHRDSELRSHSIAIGARLSRQDISTRLAAEGARAMLNGLYMVGGRQHADHHTLIEHLVPHTASEENYRGVLRGRARAVFNGRVVVSRDAQKISAHQYNRNLLLTPEAEVDTKPELEIYADDVQCSHGATVGQLDEQALFYLRTRGIPEDMAANLLTYAFAADVVERIAIPAIVDRLKRDIIGLLPGAEKLEGFL